PRPARAGLAALEQTGERPVSPAFRPGPAVSITISGDDEVLYAACLPAGPIMILQGAGRVIWTEATSGSSKGWIERVAQVFEVDAVIIEADVGAFVDDLTRRGLLVAEPVSAE
ncbi:MAG: PqqD family protein, partial [Humibacillus sp.]